MKILADWLTDLKDYLLFFTGSDASKNMEEQELKEILLHAIPNAWSKHVYLKGLDF